MINVGCGPIGHPDWINIDYGILPLLHRYKWLEKIISFIGLWPKSDTVDYGEPWPKNLKLVNARKGLPFANNTVDYIFTSHFLEHIPRYSTLTFLHECHRCLKSGGVMRIAIPDIDLVIARYLNENDQLKKVEVINDDFRALSDYGLRAPTVVEKIKNIFVRGHEWMYNFAYFKMMLSETNFIDNKVVRCEYQHGSVPNLEFLDAHPDESMYIEIYKK